MTIPRLPRWIATFATCVALALPATAADNPIKIARAGETAAAAIYVAMEKGYFDEQGVKVQIEGLNASTDAMALLGTNQIQILGGAVGAAMFNSFARDWPIKLILGVTRQVPGYSSDVLLIRNELKPKIKSLADLKGLTIASNAPASLLAYMLAKFLESEKLSLKDVKLVYMPWSSMGPAFDTKAIDGGLMTEPHATLYAERNLAFPFMRAADIIKEPWLEVGVLLANTNWIAANPKQAHAFTIGYLKGARAYYEAVHGKGNRDEIISILAKHTSMKDKAMYARMEWTYILPNGDIAVPSLEQQQDWYAEQGAIPKKIDVKAAIHSGLQERAIRELGGIDAKW